MNPKTGARKFYGISIQGDSAFCEIGEGIEGISSICHLMNMPPPTAKIKSYKIINDAFHQVYCDVTSIKNMLDAAINEIHT